MGDVPMPAIGDMETIVLIQWMVSPGDTVHRTQDLAYVETDKGIIEVESFEAGVIRELLAAPGDRVAVGAPIARIDASTDDP